MIEDGAQSFGATQRGRRSCGVTLIGSTSFFPAKPLGCYGDGGALFTDDDALAEKMRAIRTHGGLKRHHHPLLGMNGRFDTLQAAVLLAKLPHFDWEVEARGTHRRALHASCCAASAACPRSAVGNTHVYAQYTIRVPNRDAVAEQAEGRRASPRPSIIRSACTSSRSSRISATGGATFRYRKRPRAKCSACPCTRSSPKRIRMQWSAAARRGHRVERPADRQPQVRR